ncbi:hypothetical protein ACLH0K_11490 [Arthrobacter sp. MPF02]|uniref:hypothetical protein n=1 Tax=Arthrobacter sp. MPF02 TaxID=3388492 RepID=UPI0039850557
MRWAALFDDIESQFSESGRLSLESEVNERSRIEMVSAGFADRLRGALGCRIAVHLMSGDTIHGVVSYAGADALVLDEDPHQVLVPYSAAARFVGLGRSLRAEASQVRRGLGLGNALRALARDRAELTVTLGSSAGNLRMEGVIDRVGKDYLDLAAVTPGEARRSCHVSHVSTIPFSALLAIRARQARDL